MNTPDFPFRDSSLPLEARVDDLLSRLTLEEKVSRMVHDSAAIERLGIPSYNWWNECLHGVARAGVATVFPQAIGLAATFNTGLVERVATVISDEARAKHHAHSAKGDRNIYTGLTFFTPNINIFRDPRWGRGQETYGECPYLTGRMGTAFVRGLQGTDPHYLKAAATAKHYAVHSGPETQRHGFNATVSVKDLYETYLPAFRDLVTEARVESVMPAYNRTNGEVCCASQTLLGRVLRGAWGFGGYVVSDCWAVRDINEGHKLTSTIEESAAFAVNQGCDLNCGCAFLYLTRAVELGLITESAIDQAVRRLLRTQFRLGMFDPVEQVPFSSIPYEVVDCQAHRELSLEAARQSLVLLKNEGGLLPLSPELKTIAVIGPNADDRLVLLGNYNGVPSKSVTPLQGIRERVSSSTRVFYAAGSELVGDGENLLPDQPTPVRARTEALLAVERAEAVVLCLGLSNAMEGEQGSAIHAELDGDRARLELPAVQQWLMEEVCALGKPVVLVMMAGSAVDLSWAKEHIPAILVQFYPGQEGGTALAEVLFGDTSPAGRLPLTFYQSVAQLPPFEDYAMEGRTYRYYHGEPVYPFGFGLSYSQFQYSQLQAMPDRVGSGSPIEVSVEVENTGQCESDEVVQLYLTHEAPSVKTPIRQLVGIARPHLMPGEKRRIAFTLAPRQLALVDEEGRFFQEPGRIRLEAGGSQPDGLSQRLGAAAPQSMVIEVVGERIVWEP